MELLRIIVRGKFTQGLNFPEDISMGRGFFRGGGSRFPGVIWKMIRNKIINKFFSNKSKTNFLGEIFRRKFSRRISKGKGISGKFLSGEGILRRRNCP